MHGSSEEGVIMMRLRFGQTLALSTTNSDGIADNFPPDCDTNEQVLEMRLRAPDLALEKVSVNQREASIREMISVIVEVTNRGNAHASDVNIILCKRPV